jgi:predicted Na+-dependent transporter
MEISKAKCARHKPTPVLTISVVIFLLVSAAWVRERLITVSYFYTYFSIIYVSVYENELLSYLNSINMGRLTYDK